MEGIYKKNRAKELLTKEMIIFRPGHSLLGRSVFFFFLIFIMQIAYGEGWKMERAHVTDYLSRSKFGIMGFSVSDTISGLWVSL